MWKLLMITYVLLNLAVKGLAQDLMVKIDGETTMRRKFCVGEQLTFFCTIRTSAYQWKAGTILSGSDGQVFIGNKLQFGRFTLSAQGSGDGRNSSLEVEAFGGLNGVLMTCEEVGNSENSQTAIVTLLDTRCPTDISADVYDNCSSADVSFTATNCTQRYIVGISGSNNMPEIFSSYLLMNDSGRLLNTGIFNLSNSSPALCSLYNVTVIAIFFDESNMTCPTVPIVSITPVNPSTTTPRDPTMTSKLSMGAIIGIVLAVILLLVISVVMVVMIIKCKKMAMSSIDPKSIQREAPNGSVYSVLDKKKPKGSKKTSEKKEELRLYSSVYKDSKDANAQEGLVYTEVSVQSSSRSSRSRHPPPPGVTQLNANEPVVYRKLESPQEDFLPTYQDLDSIQREEAPDMYSMVDKKPKGSKKKSEKKEELPLYSMVNKDKNDANAQEGWMYTEVSRSRPPTPPVVAQLDANEPVFYSTVNVPQ